MNKPLFLSALGLLFVWGCSKPEPINLVLITFDTTRADHLGCYGNPSVKTPNLDRLAAEGVLFEQAFTSVPITLPSHSAIMTGKTPFAHGVRDNGLFVLGGEQTTLAEVLAARGYRTAAAVGSFPLIGKFGLNQGFQLYDDQLAAAFQDVYGRRIYPKDRLFFDERKAARVNEAVIPWLEKNHREPFFLWVHYFDPHHPHEPPAPYNQLYAGDLYAGEIAYADECLGTLISQLRRLGVYDRSLVVFTADHGEGKGEHNEATHSLLAYNATLHVPLIVKAPGKAAGRRIQDRVGTVDIFPTVLDLMGLTAPEDIQGRSLLSAFEPQPVPLEPRPYYAETLSPRLSYGWGELRAWFSGEFKYIHGPRPELFNLGLDPGELNDLATSQPDLSKRLRTELQEYLNLNAVPGLNSTVTVDEETAQQLMALGYIQSPGANAGTIEEILLDEGTPPQDRAGDNTAFSLAKGYLFQSRFMEAGSVLGDLLATDPDNIHYLTLFVKANLGMGNFDRAVTILQNIADLQTGYPPPEKIFGQMGTIFQAQGKWGQALDYFGQSLAIKPTAESHYGMYQVLEPLGQPQPAFEHLQNALKLDERFLPARLDLAIHFASRGDVERAEEQFRKAFETNPYDARVHYNYGAFLVQGKRFEEALSFFERAIALEPQYLQAYQAMVDLLAGLGQREAAMGYYRSLKQLAPNSRETRIAQALLETE